MCKKNYQCLIPILWSGAKQYIKKSVEYGYPSYLDCIHFKICAYIRMQHYSFIILHFKIADKTK